MPRPASYIVISNFNLLLDLISSSHVDATVTPDIPDPSMATLILRRVGGAAVSDAVCRIMMKMSVSNNKFADSLSMARPNPYRHTYTYT
jgi:hypothetical protein